MVHRDRHDIVLEILRKTSSRTCSKTLIMSSVGLSYVQVQKYLRRLLEEGLIEVTSERSYRTTKKGAEFLEKCSQCILFKWDK